jgi:hypothetical protein
MTVQWGFFAGVAGGIVMALFSDVAYRLGLFRSSLIVVDGSYALRMTGRPDGKQPLALLYVLGILIHLVTSGVFGAAYPLLIGLFQVSPRSGLTFVAYVFLLWLAMLLSALPIAGLGILGRKAGRFTWFEQLLLHIAFGLVFWRFL